MKFAKLAAAVDELLEAAERCRTCWKSPCASERDREEDTSVKGDIKRIPGNTYTLLFSPVGRSFGAEYLGLWRCWKGPDGLHFFLDERVTISPGVGRFSFLSFCSLLVFVPRHTLPCSAGLFYHSLSCCICHCSILRNAPASWALAYPAQKRNSCTQSP